MAFRAKKRVFAFIIIYAILFLAIGKGLQASALALETAWPYLLMAFIVATVYAVLISQFRRRDIAILKCISWSNNEVILLVVGEVIIVALSAFLVIFQLSVEILGVIAYFSELDLVFLGQVRDFIVVEAGPMGWTLLYIVVLQIPGLILAQYRATKVPPMQALREE